MQPSKNHLSIKSVLKLIIFWRLGITLVAILGILTIPFKDSFPYRESVLMPFGHPLFYSWANFDGVHYLGIAKAGYFANFTQAFFPVYPLLVWVFNHIFNNLLLTGLIVSHLCLFGSLLILYRLIKLDFSSKIAIRTILLILCFPTSFIFGSFYTESLFLLLTVTSWYALRTKRFWIAGIIAAIASATRVTGVLLFPALLIDWYLSTPKPINFIKSLPNLIPLCLAPVGLVVYMVYLDKNFSDPLLFFHAQGAFGASRTSDKIVLLYQVIYRYIKIVFTANPRTWSYYVAIQEGFMAVFSLGLLFLAGITKKIRISYLYWSLATLILPTLTGTFSSMPRYLLTVFPFFIVIASVKNEKIFKFWIVVSLILLFINTLLFTRGFWVA